MNKNKLFTLLPATLALFVAPAAPANAQTVAAPPDPRDGEIPLVLSPFTITSERDTGYQATSTLAGTRLNTPIEDLGAAISIYTKDFIEDIGATDANELLIYATNMEAGGAQGNFSGATNDITAGNFTDNEQRVEPQSALRSRGLGSPTITRGYFLTDIPFDGYNTDRVTVSNGPNAILFGVGKPAGVVDTTLSPANMRRNTASVQARYGNNDSLRGSLDFNRVVVPGKLALRLATLYDRHEFNQRPAYEQKKRIYGALTFAPFKSTELRANFESGRTRANRPFTVLPTDNGTAVWLASGRPTYDWTFYDDPERNPNARTQAAQNFLSANTLGGLIGPEQTGYQLIYFYSDPSAQTPDFALTNRIANQITPGTFHPLVNRDLGADDIRFWSTRNINSLAAGWAGWPGGVKPPGVKQQGFTNSDAFDWQGRQIAEGSLQTQSFRTFNIAFEQRAWNDRVGLEIAYDQQRNDRRAKNWFTVGNSAKIHIDTNVTLVNGQPNPNLGRPFSVVYGQNDEYIRSTEREALRATAYLKYDFKELSPPWTKWLGRHVMTGLFEHNAAETMRYQPRLAADGAAAFQVGSDNVTTFNRRPRMLVYLGPSLVGNDNPLRLESIRVPYPKPGPTMPVSHFVRSQNGFVDSPTTFVEILSSGSAQREVIKSQAATLQSYWLREHLLTLVGWRRDEDYLEPISLTRLNADTRASPNDPGKVHYSFDDLGFARTPPINAQGEIISYSAVAKWPKKLVTLPPGVDLSGFYNFSENFSPTGGLVDAFGSSLDAPKGETKEYGINVSLFDRKLTLRLNRFETSMVGEPINSPYAAASFRSVIETAGFWLTQANSGPENVPFMNAALERLFSALPANYRELYDLGVFGEAPELAHTFRSMPGLQDTTDFAAKGMEAGIVYNPTRNWRILANVAKQETVRSNAIPRTRAFVDLMLPVWNSSITDPATGISVPMREIPWIGYRDGFGPANPPPPSTQTFGEFLDSNVTVPVARARATDGLASVEQRKWRVNLVTNYAFGRDAFGGKLRGWGVGGGLRWQSKLGLGYPTSQDADGVVHFDLDNPYYAPAQTNVDAWVSYTRKIWQDRIDWKVQLNIRNLISDQDFVGITVQPWGEVARVRIPPERRWYVTNTFSF